MWNAPDGDSPARGNGGFFPFGPWDRARPASRRVQRGNGTVTKATPQSGQPFSGSTEKADEKQNIQRRDYRPEKNESDNEQRAVSVPAHHLCG